VVFSSSLKLLFHIGSTRIQNHFKLLKPKMKIPNPAFFVFGYWIYKFGRVRYPNFQSNVKELFTKNKYSQHAKSLIKKTISIFWRYYSLYTLGCKFKYCQIRRRMESRRRFSREILC